MITKELSDVLKAAATFSDMTGKNVLMKDASGNLGAAAISSLMPIVTGKTTSFSSALPSVGLYLCAVYSESNRFINCVFTVLMAERDPVNNMSSFKVIDSQGCLTVQAVNAYGTISLKMTDSTTRPSDLRLVYIGVKI